MKKNILIFCSWLDLDSNIGIFFREQATLISDQYNPILVVFKQDTLTRKRFNYYNIISIEEKKTKEGLLLLEVYYAYSDLLHNKVNEFFKKKTISYLKAFLSNKNINVSFIHAQSIFDAGIWALRYKQQFKIPYIITEHNQLSFYNVSKEKCNLVRKSLQNSAINLVVSNDKIRQFVSNGLFFDFKNIGNLINKKFLYDAKNSSSKTVRLITIGAFSPLKDQNTLLKALDIVDKKISKRIEFVWVGQNSWGSNQDKNVNSLLNSFHFNNIDIILKPLLDRDEIATYLRTSHLFLFSSLSEGMPVSVLEALACGLPVFTSNCGGVDEIINDKNGVIYQIKDYVKLSSLILDFLNNELHYNGEEISKEIIDRFGEYAFRENLLSIYQSIK